MKNLFAWYELLLFYLAAMAREFAFMDAIEYSYCYPFGSLASAATVQPNEHSVLKLSNFPCLICSQTLFPPGKTSHSVGIFLKC
jgi:hypothetical protein